MPQAAPCARRTAARFARRRSGDIEAAVDNEAVEGQVEDRLDVVRRGQHCVRETLQRGEALDRDRLKRSGRPSTVGMPVDRPNRRRRPEYRRRPSSPIGIPSSLAHASRTTASGTTSWVPGMVPSKTSPVSPSMVMTSPARSARSPMRTRRRRPRCPRPRRRRGSPSREPRQPRGSPSRRGTSGSRRPGHPVNVVG